MPTRYSALAGGLLVSLPMLLSASPGPAQETWQRSVDPRYQQREEAYRPDAAPQRYDAPGDSDPRTPPPAYPAPPPNDAYTPPRNPNDTYGPPPRPPGYAQGPGTYGPPYSSSPPPPAYGQPYSGPPGPAYGQPYSTSPRPAYGEPYTPPPGQTYDPSERAYGPPGPRYDDDAADGSYSSREILQAGHGFFGSVSKGLASVVEYAFQT